MFRRPVSAQTRLLRFDGPGRRLLYLSIAASFLATVCIVSQGYVLSGAVDRVFLQRRTAAEVAPLLALLLAVAMLRAAILWGADVLAQRAASRIKGRLREAMARHILALGPANTQGESSGELVHASVEAIEGLDDYITVYQPVRLLAMLTPVFVLLVVLALDPPTTLVLLFTGPMLVLALALIGSRTRDITERRFRELSWMSAFFLDMLQGLATLKLFGRSREQIENIRRISAGYGNTTMEVLQTAFQSALVLEFGGTVATAVVAVEISLRLMAGHIPFHNALAVLVITPEFFLPLRQFALRYHAGAAGRAAAERVFAVLDVPLRRQAGIAPAAVAATAVPPQPDIRLEHVSFAYEGGRGPALQDVSLTLPYGCTTALVGETGAGKTTIASLLLRFIEPDSGNILVGDLPLSALDLSLWRSMVGWVPQLPHLFHGSVGENIRLARPNAGEDEVMAAARAANAHEFIAALPQGYDTPIGEGGARLSGGQRQRIAIARAFLKNAPILILDEATANLDAASETAIQDALVRLMHGRTTLIIAHRLRFVYRADQVVVMEQGRVVATGSHAWLLVHNPTYARLVATYEGGA